MIYYTVDCEGCDSPATWRVAPKGDLTRAELLCDLHWETRMNEMMVSAGRASADPIWKIWNPAQLTPPP